MEFTQFLGSGSISIDAAGVNADILHAHTSPSIPEQLMLRLILKNPR